MAVIYECGICGKQYHSVGDRAKCENACLENYTKQKKLEEKKRATMSKIQGKLDEVCKMIQDYEQEFGEDCPTQVLHGSEQLSRCKSGEKSFLDYLTQAYLKDGKSNVDPYGGNKPIDCLNDDALLNVCRVGTDKDLYEFYKKWAGIV